MSSTTNIVVTPSTSLILIRNVSTPTNIYLSSYNTPNFTISVRDVTGSSTIQTSSVYLSTVGTSRFIDGSFLYTLNQPYGFVNLGFRNSSFWQVLHTSGQTPEDSAATVGKLNLSTSYTGFLSTTSTVISSFIIENLTTTNSITINGPFVITNLSAPGIVTVQSTFNVYGNVQVDRQLFVSGNSLFHSSLTTTELLPISSITRVFSSFGVGGTLSVGGTLTIGSTLFTQSANFVSSLQVQKSTPAITTTVEGILTVGGLLSSLRSFSVEEVASVNKLQDFVFIRESVSSTAENATFSTNTLDVFGQILGKSSFQANSALLVSSMNIQSTLRILRNTDIHFLAVGGNYFTELLSTNVVSTLSSFSTGALTVTVSTFLSSGLSTTGIEVFENASISKFVQTAANVIAAIQSDGVFVKDEVNVRNNAFFDYVSFGNNIETYGLTASTITVGNAMNFSSISTLGDFTAGNTITIGDFLNPVNGFRVFSTATVNQNLINSGDAYISAINAPSYSLETLFIRTSSPSISLRASTLECFNASTTELIVSGEDTLTVNSTFASLTQFNIAIAEATRVETAYTSSLFWGLSTFPGVDVSLDALSLFPKGLSAHTLLVNSITAKLFSSIKFLGDAQGVSNVTLGTISTLSVITAFASTVSTSAIYTSSLYTSSFSNSSFTVALSSFQSPTLAIEGIGYPFRNDINQILLINSNVYAINQTLFIDSLTNRVGVNISTPLADLHISGGLYTEGGFYYSSINFLVVSSPSVTNLSTIDTAYAFIRDEFGIGGSNAYFVNPSINPFLDSSIIQSTFFTLDAQSGDVGETGNLFSLTTLPSSISLLNTLFIHNDVKTISLLSNYADESGNFVVGNMYVSTIGNFSSVQSLSNTMTASLTTPDLLIHPDYFPSVNTMSTGSQGLYINDDLFTVFNTFIPKMGIKTKNPTVSLDINGSAYFSSVSANGFLSIRNLSMGSSLL